MWMTEKVLHTITNLRNSYREQPAEQQAFRAGQQVWWNLLESCSLWEFHPVWTPKSSIVLLMRWLSVCCSADNSPWCQPIYHDIICLVQGWKVSHTRVEALLNKFTGKLHLHATWMWDVALESADVSVTMACVTQSLIVVKITFQFVWWD